MSSKKIVFELDNGVEDDETIGIFDDSDGLECLEDRTKGANK